LRRLWHCPREFSVSRDPNGTRIRMSASDAAIILAAGLGTRMKSALPKVLHPVGARPMVQHVVAAVKPLDPGRTVVVVGPDMDAVAAAVAPHPCVIQPERLGTADAVKAAREALGNTAFGTVLVLYGDTPFIRTETLERMRAARRDGASVVVLGFRPGNPDGYGRLMIDAGGRLERIVEDRDASPAEKAVELCNSGVMAVDAARLFDLVDRIGNANAKGEYYLTDIVALARADDCACAVIEAPAEELMGVDSRAALARAEGVFQSRMRARAMQEGATLQDPETVWFSFDTVLGQDVTVEPNVVFGPGVTVGDGVSIRAFCHLDGVTVEPGAMVGPFARLRPGAVIGRDVHVGNFVEVKNAVLGKGAKANHLSYIGDTDVGTETNIGAGTITCNYDGYNKHRTVIGKSVFVGSNTALVAPVRVGDGAVIGAGSTIVRDVDADTLSIARGAQVDLPGRARTLREKLAAIKAGKKPDKKSRGT
jgi:bifunctional UDP-N-acetylglucosamine pyrophosphorylase/glucosamine-1-phosphate N-acetyltransferase